MAIDLNRHWEMIQRGIYRRDLALELYYECERLVGEVASLKRAPGPAVEVKEENEHGR